MSEPVTYRYWAFLSYSHRDTVWGKWLHKALEGYRIDKDLVGRKTPIGIVPKTLRPIFRDREDFSAGHSLTEQTLAALEASHFLIVICSPNAAQSKYVNEEVRRFKMLGRGGRIIPIIVDGEPGDPARECFAPALRCKVGSDGEITDEREEPVAADARTQGDGKEIAKQKVVAGLLGLGLDEIVRRAERARKRRHRVWAALAGVFLLLAIAASGSAVYAWQQLKTNEAFLNAALQRATEIVDEAVAQAEKYNVPRTATLRLLVRAEGLFADMAQYGRPTAELRYRKAWMLIQFTRNYAVLGDTGKQRDRAMEALSLLGGLAAEKPNDVTYQESLAAAYDEVGDVLVLQGQLSEALQAFRNGLAVRESLIKAQPDNADLQRSLAVSYDRIGFVLEQRGDFKEALEAHRRNLSVVQHLAAAEPGDAGRQRDIAVIFARIGDVLVAQGNPAEALQAFRNGFAIAERLAADAPDNAGWQRNLSVFHQKIGKALLDQGNLNEALEAFRHSLAIFERLTRTDPSNAIWQRDMLKSNGLVAAALVAQGKLPQALAAYRDGLAISQRLAKADPANAERQHDLSNSYSNIGDVLVRQGNLAEALEADRTSLGIIERLANAEPGNAVWQRDFAFAFYSVGDVLLAQGKLDEALQALRTDLSIRERLLRSHPEHAEWQRDLAWAYNKLTDVLLDQHKLDEALQITGESLAITERLAKETPDNPALQRDSAVSHRRRGGRAAGTR